VLPFLLGILLAFQPSMPPFLGSVLIAALYGWNLPQFFIILSRIAIIFSEMLIFMTGILNAVCYAAYFLMAGLLAMLFEIEKMQTSYKKDQIQVYRKLQVFEALLNSSVRFYIFPVTILIAPIIQILAGFATIHLHNQLGISLLIFLTLAFIEGTFVDVLFLTGAKQVYVKSYEWLSKMRRIHGMDRIRRRVLKSMLPLRVWFGNNWVDRTTPLVLQQFCSIQTTNLLLLARK
jgi:hypothetical protein